MANWGPRSGHTVAVVDGGGGGGSMVLAGGRFYGNAEVFYGDVWRCAGAP